jgi:hypothetical protein
MKSSLATRLRKKADDYNNDTSDVMEMLHEAAEAGEYEVRLHLTDITRDALLKNKLVVTLVKDDLYVVRW